MIKHAYCLKKNEKIYDRKAIDYCLTAGNFEAICKNFSLQKNSNKGIKIIPIKVLEEVS